MPANTLIELVGLTALPPHDSILLSRSFEHRSLKSRVRQLCMSNEWLRTEPWLLSFTETAQNRNPGSDL